MRKIPAQILVASLVLTALLALVVGYTVREIGRASTLATSLGEQQVDHLERAEQLEDLLFEKGYVSSYLASGDRRWIHELERRKIRTKAWLNQLARDVGDGPERPLIDRLRASYESYDRSRDATVAAYDAGEPTTALARYDDTHRGVNQVLDAAKALARESRRQLISTLEANERHLAQARLRVLAVACIAALCGVLFGAWSGRRIARPIYDLILKVESADPERVRLDPGERPGDEFALLSAQVTRLVERLAEQRRRLVQAEKMQALGEISARLAHEVLNPVAAVKAALQAEIRHGPLTDASRAVLVEADRTISRVDGIISRLVRFSRPLEARHQRVDVAKVLESGVAAASAALGEARVRAEVEAGPLPVADLDPELVAQVVTNLVVNAAQASPSGEVVRVRARGEDHQLVIEVEDRGKGLPAERDRLFRPYFTTRERGHGLGLAICRNIVAEHGGTIEAADAPGGRGARFLFTLPQPEAAWASPS